jgi:hypothetical protein
MKNFCVYHIACMNDWKTIFDDQINTIVNSNILNDLDGLYITLIYQKIEDIVYIEEKIKNLNKTSIKYKTTNFYEYEFPALKLVRELSEKFDCNILYFHTKGVSINEINMGFYHGSKDIIHLKNCVNDWRKYMEYFVIENYENCLYHLKEYDACGVNLVNEPSKHFSGNFWWSKSSHINKLPEIKNIDINHRWNAEFWIGRFDGKFKNFYSTKAGYVNRIIENYKNK